MASKDELVGFLDTHVFDPILDASPSKYSDEQQEDLHYVQEKTHAEKERYHGYSSADEIIRMYRSDLTSENAKPVNRKLQQLGLPRLVDVKEEFQKKAA